ncbi:MAG: transglycosylase domain-containing protein [Spirochaetes bacterium]|nr:transglycosylase domain-containing protein [Spirochaetota bacterium]
MYIFINLFNKINPSVYGFTIYRTIKNSYKIKFPKYINKNELPNFVFKMLIYVEDCNFYKHKGFDFEALKEAYILYKKYKKPIKGGSTISQQLARTLFLYPDRTIIRKYLEIIATFIIENSIPKDKILELYINTVEFGKGIFGIEQASYFYYKKSAKYLTKEETIILLTLLASPIKYDVNNFYKRKALIQRYILLKNKFIETN